MLVDVTSVLEVVEHEVDTDDVVEQEVVHDVSTDVDVKHDVVDVL